MTKTLVHHHSSNLIVFHRNGGRFFSNIYDDTYPRVEFRRAINPLGGNQNREDHSPLSLLEREISEEFSGEVEEQKEIEEGLRDEKVLGSGPGAPEVTNLAPRDDIDYVRNSLLAKVEPYIDFLLDVPSLGGRPPVKVLTSVFVSELPDSEVFFDVVGYNHHKGLSLVNEGFTTTTSVGKILSGEVPCAWGTGGILGSFLGYYASRKIPNPNEVKVIPIGLPRELLQDYLDEFSYETG